MRLRTTLCSCLLGVLVARASAGAQNREPLPLTLAQAIALALKQNREVKLAEFSVIEAEHKKEIARSAYYPHISNDSKFTYITQLAGVQIPAGAFGNHPDTGLIPGQNLLLDQGSVISYTSGTGLAQPVSQMFKIRESNRAAAADFHGARAQASLAQNQIALKVRQLYYGILIAQMKEQAAQEEVAASQVKVAETLGDVERGRALEVAALESRASALEAQQTALVERLRARDLRLELDDLLGLPLDTMLQLDADVQPATALLPSREECVQIAQKTSPEIQAARQSVDKAKAGVAAAKEEYIPDVTALARYSYQSGIPFLVHNFGTFGVSFTYDLFDGGKRVAQVKDARTMLSEAELNLTRIEEEVSVQVETAYDKVEQMENLVGVAEQVLQTRAEAARVADRRFEQAAALASARAEAHAKATSAQASSLEAALGLSFAQGELRKSMGVLP